MGRLRGPAILFSSWRVLVTLHIGKRLRLIEYEIATTWFRRKHIAKSLDWRIYDEVGDPHI